MGTVAVLYCNFGPPEVVGQSAELNETDFTLGAVLIGRNPNIAIPIPDEEVSRVHCSLEYTKEGFTVMDENSTNGTRINGEKLEPHKPFKLHQDDQISLGHTSFIFSLVQPGYDRSDQQEMARELLQKYGWQVGGVKGFRYWIVPNLARLKETDPIAKRCIMQAFESSAQIGLDLTPHLGKRMLMEKYQVSKEEHPEYEAYVLFLNGRIAGAYVVDPDNGFELMALNGSKPLSHKSKLLKATKKARNQKQTDPLGEKALVNNDLSHSTEEVYAK
ncbi:MAG: FHA domain-containing protein [Chloroflexota bacterium]